MSLSVESSVPDSSFVISIDNACAEDETSGHLKEDASSLHNEDEDVNICDTPQSSAHQHLMEPAALESDAEVLASTVPKEAPVTVQQTEVGGGAELGCTKCRFIPTGCIQCRAWARAGGRANWNATRRKGSKLPKASGAPPAASKLPSAHEPPRTRAGRGPAAVAVGKSARQPRAAPQKPAPACPGPSDSPGNKDKAATASLIIAKRQVRSQKPAAETSQQPISHADIASRDEAPAEPRPINRRELQRTKRPSPAAGIGAAEAGLNKRHRRVTKEMPPVQGMEEEAGEDAAYTDDYAFPGNHPGATSLSLAATPPTAARLASAAATRSRRDLQGDAGKLLRKPNLDESGSEQQREHDATAVAVATPVAMAGPVMMGSAPPGPCVLPPAMQPAPVPAGGALQHLVAPSDPALLVTDWLLAALADPRAPEARCAVLRPALQRVVDKVVGNLENTINLGHNNSILLLGPRGAGKSLAVECALAAVAARYNTNVRDPIIGAVRLVGWAHADERTAFRELARQLCETFQLTFHRTASVGDNIEFLRAMLSALARAHKTPVFILDDFDAFAKRSKQTLLYCLLDALQTSGVQAAVVGLTCRHDCLDLLEKRVKSRFSHRTIELCTPRGAAPRPAIAADEGSAGDEGSDGAIDVLRHMLTLPIAQGATAHGEGFMHAEHAAAHNSAVEVAVSAPDVLPALELFVAMHPNLRDLANVAECALLAAEAAPRGLLTPGAITAACSAVMAGSDNGTVGMVAGLSVLEMAVLVAAHRAVARMRVRGDRDAVNFEMIHHEFSTFSRSGDHVDNYTRGAAAKAFDRLLALGLLAPADGRAAGSRQYAVVHVQVRPEELRAGMEAHPTCPARLREWFAREGALATTAVAMY